MDSRTGTKVSGCASFYFFARFVDSRTVSEIHLPAGCPRVYGLGGQVIAEFTGVDDVIGKRRALAPVLEIVRRGVCQLGYHSRLDSRTCHRALRSLIGDDGGKSEDTRRECEAEVIWSRAISEIATGPQRFDIQRPQLTSVSPDGRST